MNLDSYQIYDISPEISEKIAVFPGDTPFGAQFLMDIEKGDHLTLSTINTTVHLGAHTDAPSHYSAQGATMERCSVKTYMGLVQIISVDLPLATRILPEHIEDVEIVAPRILFKTRSFENPNSWHNDFCALSQELIEYLAAKGVILVGLDTPSVDLATDKILEAHSAIARANMAILEGVVLTEIEAGLYQLIALPLKIKGADASPVRALLIR